MTDTSSAEIDFLKAAGLADAPEEEQHEFMEQVARVVLARTVERVAASLSEELRERFFELFTEESSDKEKIAFLKDNVPDFAQITIEETLKLKQEALEAIEKGTADGA